MNENTRKCLKRYLEDELRHRQSVANGVDTADPDGYGKVLKRLQASHSRLEKAVLADEEYTLGWKNGDTCYWSQPSSGFAVISSTITNINVGLVDEKRVTAKDVYVYAIMDDTFDEVDVRRLHRTPENAMMAAIGETIFCVVARIFHAIQEKGK